MNIDYSLAIKAPKSLHHKFALKLQNESVQSNFMQANEYLDFINFIENELGVNEYRRLRRLFEIQEHGESLTYDENLELIDV